MKRPFSQFVIVMVIALLAISICLIGFRKNKQELAIHGATELSTTHTSQMVSAGTGATLASVQERLTALEEQLNSNYQDEGHEFIQDTVTEADLAQISEQLNQVPTDSAAYEENAVPSPGELAALEQQKNQAQAVIATIQGKLQAKQAVQGLFMNTVNNWLEPVNDVIIQADLTLEAIASAKQVVDVLQDGSFKNILNEYLSFATAQMQRSLDLRSALDAAMPEGKLAAGINQTTYNTLSASLGLVRNETLKKEFSEKLAQLQSLLQ